MWDRKDALMIKLRLIVIKKNGKDTQVHRHDPEQFKTRVVRHESLF